MAFRPFTFMSEKIPEIAREYVSGVGALTVAWAHLELALDSLIAIHTELGSVKKRMPISFKAKIERLTAALKEGSPHIVPYKGELLQIIVLSTQASTRRHLAVHGALMGTLSDNEMRVLRLVRREQEDDIEEGKVSFLEMFLIFEMVYETATHAHNLVIRLFNEQVPKSPANSDLQTIDVSGFRWPAINPKYPKLQRKKDRL